MSYAQARSVEVSEFSRPRRATVRRLVLPLFVCAALVTYFVVAGPMLITAFRRLAGASPTWLLIGLISTVGSMIAFGLLRRQTLAVGGANISLSQTLAVSYGAGAVHTTLPVGALFSTTYAFRHLRAWGASAAAATWSLTITGVLSAVTLSAVGLLGLVLNTGRAAMGPTVGLIVGLLLFIGLVRATRRSHGLTRLTHRKPIGGKRPEHPAGNHRAWLSKIRTGLSKVMTDLRSIHPSGRDWAAAGSLALLNWGLDLGCLAACCAAVGVHVSLAALLITYAAGMAAGSLLPVPAGLGAVETAMTVALTVAGAAASPALAGILLFRLLSTGSVLVIGWLVIAAQQIHPSPHTSHQIELN